MTEQAAKPHWLSGVVLGTSSVVLLFIFITILAWVKEITTTNGEYDTTLMTLAFWGGMFVETPCALVSLFGGISGLSRGLVKKGTATAEIVIGLLGILLGGASWAFFLMMQAFTF